MISKKTSKSLLITMAIFIITINGFAKEKFRGRWNYECPGLQTGQFIDKKPGGGPGMYNMQFREGMEYDPELMSVVEYLKLEPILEKYRIKIGKIFLDSKELKVDINTQRKELIRKLNDLINVYKTNDSVRKELQDSLKNLKQLNDKIMNINKDAMEKIRKLNEEREKEIDKLVNDWLKKIESDKTELDKFIKFMEEKRNEIPYPLHDKKPFKFGNSPCK